jgi:hypothetical protein
MMRMEDYARWEDTPNVTRWNTLPLEDEWNTPGGKLNTHKEVKYIKRRRKTWMRYKPPYP